MDFEMYRFIVFNSIISFILRNFSIRKAQFPKNQTNYDSALDMQMVNFPFCEMYLNGWEMHDKTIMTGLYAINGIYKL